MSSIKSEDEIGRKYDKFASNLVIKMGTGVTVGALFSLLVFRRRIWPLYFGAGTGLGFAANQFQNDLNQQMSR